MNTKASEKPIRWFYVEDSTEGQVISARSHSRAKIKWFSDAIGAYDSTFECMKHVRAKVVTVKLAVEPKAEGECYDDIFELLEKGVYDNAITYEPCKKCACDCYEMNPQRFDKEKGFYCNECHGK